MLSAGKGSASQREPSRSPKPRKSVSLDIGTRKSHTYFSSRLHSIRPMSPLSPLVQSAPPFAISSKYLMNDIPRGTSRARLMNSLLTPRHLQGSDTGSGSSERLQPDVMFGCIMADSRLDDELSVASINFSVTPKWLQDLSRDPFGFPKETAFGTLWRGVDTKAIDEEGRTEFIRAVIKGSSNLHYAEMLAEFEDTDVNIQDKQGRTALHWASEANVSVMIELCLSVLECEIGLKDNDGLTAFDISLRVSSGSETAPALFYKSMFEMQETHPQAALLRVLTVTSEPDLDKRAFPGTAIFAPLQDDNIALVNALIDRGIDHTAKNQDGDTALHVVVKVGNVEIATRLLENGADVNAIGNGGATPLHYAAEKKIVQALLVWEAKPNVRDTAGMTPLDLARDPMIQQELKVAMETEVVKEKEAAKKKKESVPDREPDLKAAVRHFSIESFQTDGEAGEPNPPPPTIRMAGTESIQELESRKVATNKETDMKLDYYHKEVSRLSTANNSLVATNTSLAGKYERKREQLVSISKANAELQTNFLEIQATMENVIRNQLQQKDSELDRLRDELRKGREEVRILQLHGSTRQDTPHTKDLHHFSSSCQQLFGSLKIWCNQFSSYSAGKKCLHVHRIVDEAARDRVEGVMLDDRGVRKMLKDENRRPEVLMAVTMRMVWEHVFTRYLFGLEIEERQKLLSLERTLAENGSPKAIHRWREITLTSLSVRPTFKAKCTADTDEVVNAIIRLLNYFLPPPSQYTSLARDSLRFLLQSAIQLSIEMRIQPAEYLMKRPPGPEYDDNGDVSNNVPFCASFMQNRGAEPASDQELEAEGATVKLILFPQVIRRGNELGEDYETEFTVFPMQVLVSRPRLKTESRVSNTSAGSALRDDQHRAGISRLTTRTDQTVMSGILPIIPEQTIRLIPEHEEAIAGDDKETKMRVD